MAPRWSDEVGSPGGSVGLLVMATEAGVARSVPPAGERYLWADEVCERARSATKGKGAGGSNNGLAVLGVATTDWPYWG